MCEQRVLNLREHDQSEIETCAYANEHRETAISRDHRGGKRG